MNAGDQPHGTAGEWAAERRVAGDNGGARCAAATVPLPLVSILYL